MTPHPSQSSKHVAIIGGGVIGACSAYFLAKAGCKVTILEKGRFAGGCSHGNCGLISPSHMLPLTQPSAIGRAIKAMLNPGGPFSIKLKFDPALLGWLMKFGMNCNRSQMLKAAEGRHGLLQSSAALYEQMIKTENLACEWQRHGCLFVYPDRRDLNKFDETNRMLTERFGVGAKKLDGDALIELEPALKPGLGGAWLYEVDSHMRPDRLMLALKNKLDALGVNIIEGATCTGLKSSEKQARAIEYLKSETINSSGNNAELPVQIDQPDGEPQTIEADQILFAAGAWSPKFGRLLGARIPVQPGKGYSMTMDRPEHCPKHPMILEGHRVAVTPMESGYRLGSTMQFAGYDSKKDQSRLKLLTDGASHYLHTPHTSQIHETWFGWRPMTVDGVPIIDRSPALANVFIAAGHNMLGLSMGPGTGKLVTELMLGLKPHLDPRHYQITRF